MNKKKLSVFASVFLTMVCIVFVSSCARETTVPGELRFGFTTEPSTFDPLNPANTADGRSILFNVFEGLVKPDTDGIMQPCIAESWTIDEDALVYSFTIRNDVRFHDGSVVSAEDVKFSLDTAKEAGFIGLDSIENIAIENRNIKISLKQSDTEFLPFLTVGIVKANNTDREKNICGTGPFFIESYNAQQNLVLKRFDNYWQEGFPHLDKVTIVFFANNDALLLALRGGSIDGAKLTGAMTAQLDAAQFDIIDNYSASVQVLALNNAVPPLNNVNVRRALNYGIDVLNIIDAAFFGAGIPSGSPVIPGLASFENGLNYPYEAETARALLAEEGFDEEHKLTLEITVPSNYTMHIDTAQVIVSQLEKIGVSATIKLVDCETWLNDVYVGRQYEATIISLDSPIVSAKSFLARYNSSAADNFMNFSSADFDETYNAALKELDNAKRDRLYREAQQIITENAAGVFIQDIFYFFVLRGGRFGGALNYPLYVIDFASMYETEILRD
jgi:peptide/nickel transport system substrate-binding protein